MKAISNGGLCYDAARAEKVAAPNHHTPDKGYWKESQLMKRLYGLIAMGLIVGLTSGDRKSVV